MKKLETAKYITIHGPDGVGKTSVGRNMGRVLVGHGRPAVFFDDWRNANDIQNPFSAENFRKRIEARSHDYIALQLAKTSFDSIAITQLTDSGITVIKDRGILDVRADLKYRGLDPDDCSSPLIREPDFAVFLMVSEETRTNRLDGKSDVLPGDYQPNTPGNRMFEMNQSLFEQIQGRIPERGMIVDTESMTLEEVVGVITDRIIGNK